jgi:hypothetical protein
MLCGAGIVSDRTEVTAVPWSLRGQCGVLTHIRVGTLGWIRPLLVPPRGQDSGEVMSFLYLVRLSLMKRSWPALALALGLVFLDQLGLGRSGSCWLIYCGPLGLITNHCLETLGDYDPDTKLLL